jgi:hypothetical protein
MMTMMMFDSEDNCVFCSKCLVGLNDFNRKMHLDTCKVRKLLVNSEGTPNGSNTNGNTNGNVNGSGNSNAGNNPNNSSVNQSSDLQDSQIIIGDKCQYCFKSFEDFKNDFNKRLHIKCCKLKTETNQLVKVESVENCIYCMKPLGNLNEFNKRMHTDNCKIRKSIEGNMKKKDGSDNGYQGKSDNIDLGDSCLYCSKSFHNLSNFNKKLHFEYCKLKKKKLNLISTPNGHMTNNGGNANNGPTGGLNTSQMNSSANSINSYSQLNHSYNSLNDNTIANLANLTMPLQTTSLAGTKLDLGDTCLFCSRTLYNLSNFNKRVHIETCKIKTLKKATNNANKVRRANPNKNSKKVKKEININHRFVITVYIYYSCQKIDHFLFNYLIHLNLLFLLLILYLFLFDAFSI